MKLLLPLLLAMADSNELVAPVESAGIAPRICREARSAFINGAKAVVDPLGRGLWVVDDENDEVLLVTRARPHTSGGTVQRFRVGAWPEQVLPTPSGRTFVSARQAGHVAVIEPDGSSWVIPLATEPRALALDLTTNRLYVALVTAFEVAELDAETGAVLRRRVMQRPPDLLAMSSAGLLVASRRDDLIHVLDGSTLANRFSVSLDRLEREAPQLAVSLAFLGGFRGRGWDFGDEGPTQHAVVALAVMNDHFSAVLEVTRPQAAFGRSSYGGGFEPIEHRLVHGVVGPGGLLVQQTRIINSGSVADLAMGSARGLLAIEGEPWLWQIKRGEPEGISVGLTSQAIAEDDDGRVVVVSRSRRSLTWLRERSPKRPWEFVADAMVPLPPSRIDAELRRGRALFFGNDFRVTGTGLTCATCHPDGREDGRVWVQANTLRQTPMLADRLEGTAPFNWLGSKATLDANIRQTISERLLGSGLPRSDLAALTRFVREGLRPVQHRADGSLALVAEGRSLFHDEAVGCAGCHDSERSFTDGDTHDVGSLSARERRLGVDAALAGLGTTSQPGGTRRLARFDTPSLRHVRLTAPYLHDGSVATLGELIDDNRDRMGTTSQLTASQRRALVTYLESL